MQKASLTVLFLSFLSYHSTVARPSGNGQTGTVQRAEDSTSPQFDLANETAVIPISDLSINSTQLDLPTVNNRKEVDTFADGVRARTTRAEYYVNAEGSHNHLANPDFYRMFVENGTNNWWFRIIGTAVEMRPWKVPVISQARLERGQAPALPWTAMKEIENRSKFTFDVFYVISPALISHLSDVMFRNVDETDVHPVTLLFFHGVFGLSGGMIELWYANWIDSQPNDPNPGLTNDLKALINDPMLNGMGTIHELGYWRECVLVAAVIRKQDIERSLQINSTRSSTEVLGGMFIQESRELSYTGVQALYQYMLNTEPIHAAMVEKLGNFFEDRVPRLARQEDRVPIMIESKDDEHDDRKLGASFRKTAADNYKLALDQLKTILTEVPWAEKQSEPTWVGTLRTTSNITYLPGNVSPGRTLVDLPPCAKRRNTAQC